METKTSFSIEKSLQSHYFFFFSQKKHCTVSDFLLLQLKGRYIRYSVLRLAKNASDWSLAKRTLNLSDPAALLGCPLILHQRTLSAKFAGQLLLLVIVLSHHFLTLSNQNIRETLTKLCITLQLLSSQPQPNRNKLKLALDSRSWFFPRWHLARSSSSIFINSYL